MRKYRVVKKVNGLGDVKFYVEQCVAFFFWRELAQCLLDIPLGECVRFDTHDGAARWIEERMRDEAGHTWKRV